MEKIEDFWISVKTLDDMFEEFKKRKISYYIIQLVDIMA